MPKWPTGDDLAEWLESSSKVSAERRSGYDAVVRAATDMVKGDLDEFYLPDDGSCPDSVFTAILIVAARLDTRKQSANGVISSGESVIFVARRDPDYQALIAPYAVSAVP